MPKTDTKPDASSHVFVKPPKTQHPEDQTVESQNQSSKEPMPKSAGSNKSGSKFKTIPPKLGLVLSGLICVLLATLILVALGAYANLNNRLDQLTADQRSYLLNLQTTQQKTADLTKNPYLQKVLQSVVRIERRIGTETVKQIRAALGPRLDKVDRDKLPGAADAREYWELAGTGVVVDKDLILTNKHVIGLNYDYRAIDSNNQVIDVVRAAVHPVEDLGLLQATTRKDLPALPLGQKAAPGDQVFAIGHPLGLTNTISQGLVSSISRNFLYESDNYFGYIRLPQAIRDSASRSPEDDKLGLIFRNQDQGYAQMLQHNASINYGSSGGPIVNTQGELVALNTFGIKRQDTRTFNMSPGADPNLDINNYKDLENKVNEGYAPSSDFSQNGAIYRDVISRFLDAFKNKTDLPILEGYGSGVTPSEAGFWGLPTGYGFWLQGLADPFYGINEPGVTPGGDLAQAGLQNGDLITSVAGRELNTASIGNLVNGFNPGEETNIVFYRQREDKTWEKKEAKLKIAGIKVWSDEDLRNMKLGNLTL